METLQLSRKAAKKEDESSLPIVTGTVRRQVIGRKFMQTLDDQVYRDLVRFADRRGVTVQGLIRAVIVPDWIISQNHTRANHQQSMSQSGATETTVKSADFSAPAKGPSPIQR